jgi:tellurite methyltransferase
MKASTRPGGLILIDTFTAATARCNRGPSNPDFLLEDGELEKVFSDWEILTAEAAAQPVPRAAVLARRPL